MPGFFADLDRQLPPERSEGGLPSRGDFQAYDLLAVVERFATGFDDLPQPIPGRQDYRVLITTGRLVAAVAVTGQLAGDRAVELVQLDIDTTSPATPDPDPDPEDDSEGDLGPGVGAGD